MMNFIDNGDGTVSDTTTGLMWQQVGTPNRMTWKKALAYCEGLYLGGHTDWRLPTIQEMKSIVDYTRHDPAINTTRFLNTAASWYWSSTTFAGNTYCAWVVNFYDGYDGYDYKDYGYFVRAVRGGQVRTLDASVI